MRFGSSPVGFLGVLVKTVRRDYLDIGGTHVGRLLAGEILRGGRQGQAVCRSFPLGAHGKTSGERWVRAAESAIAVVQRQRLCESENEPQFVELLGRPRPRASFETAKLDAAREK